MRNAVEEIRGAVERVDDPAVARVAARHRTALLEQKPVAGADAGQFGLERALGLEVRGRDEFAGPLDRDLQLLDLAKIAQQPARRLERGIGHDIEDG